MKKLQCQTCLKLITAPNYKRHIRVCPVKKLKVINYSEAFITNNGTFTCVACKKEYKSINAIKQHYRLMHTDEGKLLRSKLYEIHRARPAWNKGLSKETDERVKKYAENTSKTTKGRPGPKHSEETRKKLSAIRKKYLKEHPDQVPYLLNHSSKISYPEQYFIDCFSNLINVSIQVHVHTYKLDFANEEEKIYFEIDGEQHYVDKKIVEHDLRRTEKLLELGWSGIRLRWSYFQKLSEEEKIKKVKEIIDILKWK